MRLRSKGPITPVNRGRVLLANLPPGSYHSEDDHENDSDSSSSVLALDEPPEHLRRSSNRDAPIPVDSDNDNAGGDGEQDLLNVETPDQRRDGGIMEENYRKRLLEDLNDSEEEEEEDADYIPHGRAKRLRPDRFADVQGSLSPLTFPRPSSPFSEAGSSVPDDFPAAVVVTAVGPSAPQYATVTAESFLADILEVLPDLDPAWALQVATAELSTGARNVVSRTVDMALDMEAGYPKIKEVSKVKGKDKEKRSDEGYLGLVYRKDRRLGAIYLSKALATLEDVFPLIPVPHIRATLFSLSCLYAPTYFRLVEHGQTIPRPYAELKRPRPVGKGKGKAARELVTLSSQSSAAGKDDKGSTEFDREKAFVEKTVAERRAENDRKIAKRVAQEEAAENGTGIECGCCFDQVLFEDTYQCAEGHLFCQICTTTHAETKLGEQQTVSY
ncbi:hypothetical protein IAR55_002077 [Kwoniella newhampshirensis]|uniref:E3 ubiquitin-protein ligase RNF216 UBA domain-containing protein n=1 Tax=Kwoniella newhampshirensis TaxID=1651941 RepID=A0AAW0YQ70_9TREE